MLRSILGIFLGLSIAFIIVNLGDGLVGKMHPLPKGFDFHDRQALEEFAKVIPLKVQLVMMMFWLLAAAAAGALSSMLRKDIWKRQSLISGSVFLLAVLANLCLVPHPIWMWIAGLGLSLPISFLAGKWVSD